MDSDREKTQEQAQGQNQAPATPRRRGNYWEITYRPCIVPFQSWRLAKDTDLATETGKTYVEVNAELGTRAVNLSGKKFETCDFNHFNLEDSSFSDCTFLDCRFVKGDFIGVKFSKCRFEACHFLNVRFEQCQFLGCTFSRISASAEHLHFIKSSISAAAFLDALVTNLASLPDRVHKRYQEYRLLSAKTKIAGGIFLSVRDEPELDQLFDANRCFEIALHRERIADACWTTNGGHLIKRTLFHRLTRWPMRQAAFSIIRTGGFFTDWGRSPGKSVWLLIGAIAVFSAVYRLVFQQPLAAAVLRAFDCTFVFGYTRYAAGGHADSVDYVMFLNAFAGFCWYALVIPALSKRLFR
jgi:hypothetical protein